MNDDAAVAVVELPWSWSKDPNAGTCNLYF